MPFELAIFAIFLAGSIPTAVLLFLTYSKKKPSLLAISIIYGLLLEIEFSFYCGLRHIVPTYL